MSKVQSALGDMALGISTWEPMLEACNLLFSTVKQVNNIVCGG